LAEPAEPPEEPSGRGGRWRPASVQYNYTIIIIVVVVVVVVGPAAIWRRGPAVRGHPGRRRALYGGTLDGGDGTGYLGARVGHPVLRSDRHLSRLLVGRVEDEAAEYEGHSKSLGTLPRYSTPGRSLPASEYRRGVSLREFPFLHLRGNLRVFSLTSASSLAVTSHRATRDNRGGTVDRLDPPDQSDSLRDGKANCRDRSWRRCLLSRKVARQFYDELCIANRDHRLAAPMLIVCSLMTLDCLISDDVPDDDDDQKLSRVIRSYVKTNTLNDRARARARPHVFSPLLVALVGRSGIDRSRAVDREDQDSDSGWILR